MRLLSTPVDASPFALVPSSPSSPLADLLPELEHVRRFAAAASAPATRRAYAREWSAFSAWCSSKHCAALPALPATLAAYISVLAVGATTRRDGRPRAPRKAAGIDLALAAITAAHKAAGLDSPRDAAELRDVATARPLGLGRAAHPTGWPDARTARDGGVSVMKTFSLACLGLLCSGVLGCAADVAPTDTGDHGPALAEQTAEGQSFVVQLSPDVTAESVIPAILAAGHVQLAAACETSPGASVRIVHALASGAFTEVPCSRILGGESTEQTSGALTSGEQVG